MNSILIEAQFFPSIEYLTRCVQADLVVIEAHEHFQKGSYRNRCHIAGANGIQVLSVPLRREKDGAIPAESLAEPFGTHFAATARRASRTLGS